MDVYLGAKCTFCLSTSLGFDQLPDFFRKPIAFASVAPLGDFHTYREKDFYLSRHHILKKEKRRLTLSEIFAHGVAFAFNSKIFEQKGIELMDNTPEEIKDLAIEMAEHLEFNKKLNSEDEELQKTFKYLYAINLKRLNQKTDNVNELWHVRDFHVMQGKKTKKIPVILHGKVRCRFSSKFLRENKYWLR